MGTRTGLAVLAFAIYGSAVLSLHQERYSRWLVESEFGLAAAVSYSVYGTPLGMANANVFKLFRNISREQGDNRMSVQEAMVRVAAGDIPAGDVLKTSTDGNGAGYPIFASLAMRLFGPQLSSLIDSFLLLVGISALVFIWRFRDDRLFMVPLQFFALTLMLLSPLAIDKWPVDESPIGGLRYFSVAGILPALHIFFEVTDRSRQAPAIGNFILLLLQVFIFAFVMLARGSVGYLLAPTLLAALFGIWASRRNRPDLRRIIGKVGFTTVAGIAFVSIIATSVPDYVTTGRLLGTVWHRAFVAFGLHPDWPFGNLREVYDCRDVIPKGLVRNPEDQNAHCVFWSAYAPDGELTDQQINGLLLDGDYEKKLRSAYFNVVLSYPWQVLELQVFYKSAMILWTLRNAIHFHLSAQSVTILRLVAVQFLVFVVFVGWGAYRGVSEITRRAWIIPVLFAFSLLPLYVAFSYPHTSIDTIFFMYASTAIGLGMLIQATIERVFRIRKSYKHPSWLITNGWNTVGTLIVSIICASIVLGCYNYFVSEDIKATASRAAHVASRLANLPSTRTKSIVMRGTKISELPPLLESSVPHGEWDVIWGLNATPLRAPTVVPDQPVLRLVAVGANGRHALAARFTGLVPGQIYRAVAWVKFGPGVHVMIEARDAVSPLTGKPSQYGVSRFNLRTDSVANSTGDILASGVEAAGDDWARVWVDLRSKDVEVFILVGLLEGRNNRHVFKADDQSVIFGGFEISQVGSPPERPIVTQVNNVGELPPLADSPFGPARWDLIEGLNAEVVERPAAVFGQRILRLVAVGTGGRHALGARFGGLASDRVYRAMAWVKAGPGVRVMIEARDAVDPLTGKPSNYGVAQVDLAARSVVNSSGDILAGGADPAADGWEKIWVDLRSRDGQLFVTLVLLEGLNNRHIFNAAGQEVSFGGFEISPARPVQTSSQVGLLARATNVDELPPLSESPFGLERWDLIEGLNAEVVERPAMITGQRILHLVAAGADGRHVLGARFSGLDPGGVYRLSAWVRAEPGARLMIEARDSIDPLTGKPSNYGVAQVDLAARSIISSTGDILASGVGAAADDWVKLWVDLRSRDGQLFALIGLLEGGNNRSVFKAAGQNVEFGGFEISPKK
jgi:hypothetical protein